MLSPLPLNSLTERKSRLLLLTKLKRKGAEETKDAIIRRLYALSAPVRRTPTLDNGTENAQHEEITSEIGLICYFAYSYVWQRRANEHININGLVRWHLPKGTDFSKISEEQIAQIESLTNNRPRKCLGLKRHLKSLLLVLHFEIEVVCLKLTFRMQLFNHLSNIAPAAKF
jgi:IS30 family transposase